MLSFWSYFIVLFLEVLVDLSILELESCFNSHSVATISFCILESPPKSPM